MSTPPTNLNEATGSRGALPDDRAWWALAGSLLLAFWAYRHTYFSIVSKWADDAAFSHGFLIAPIVVWLAWQRRADLARAPIAPFAPGLAAVTACVLLWTISRGAGVLVLEQLAAVAMIPALVLTVLGAAATRVLLMPMLFLFFAVPFGRAVVPLLMHVTADFATALLRITGIPVLRSNMYISVPGGDFEVARACSGLNYFIASFVLGVLYANRNYRGWRKRLACVVGFAVIPVVLNGLRVYITILVSYLTHMSFGPGAEHVAFGRVFFLLVMALMFWIGRRWHDEPLEGARAVPVERMRGTALPRRRWWPVLAACLVLLTAPVLLDVSNARSREQLADPSDLAVLPPASSGWRGPDPAVARWTPIYAGALLQKQGVYWRADGTAVDAFVAVYGIGTTQGPEMISASNVITVQERGRLLEARRLRITLPSGAPLTVREIVAPDSAGQRLVWSWFVVGTRAVVDPFAAKALEAIALVTRNADTERVVVLSTQLDDKARQRLAQFVAGHGHCVEAGWTREACGR